LVFDCYCKKCYPEEEKKDEENKKSNSFVVIIIISSVLFVAIIFLISYCCMKCRRSNRGIENEIIMNIDQANNGNNINVRARNNNSNTNNIFIYNNRNRNIVVNSNVNIINSNDGLHNPKIEETTIDDILADEKYLGPKKCKKEYEKYNIECTICLEKFKDDIDIISLTPCHHLFHNKCLNKYFRKNKNAKCPNCNFDIINHYKKKL